MYFMLTLTRPVKYHTIQFKLVARRHRYQSSLKGPTVGATNKQA